MSKKKIVKIISQSGSNHYYTIFKNKNLKKIKIKKYDPIKRKHFLYKEK